MEYAEEYLTVSCFTSKWHLVIFIEYFVKFGCIAINSIKNALSKIHFPFRQTTFVLNASKEQKLNDFGFFFCLFLIFFFSNHFHIMSSYKSNEYGIKRDKKWRKKKEKLRILFSQLKQCEKYLLFFFFLINQNLFEN